MSAGAHNDDKFQKWRLLQPLEELQRKANKAKRRQDIWTQEEIDAAKKEAEEMRRILGWK